RASGRRQEHAHRLVRIVLPTDRAAPAKRCQRGDASILHDPCSFFLASDLGFRRVVQHSRFALAGSTECSDQHAVLRALLRGAGYHPPGKWFSGIGQMKLWYQSLSYRAQTNPYGVVLARILASVADPD